MILRFSGDVEYSEYDSPAVSIGGVDVLRSAGDTFRDGSKVYVAMADETFSGDLYSDEGSPGYSEWTPGDPAFLLVGDHDVLDRLKELHGKHVTLWVADEPVNTLEGAEEVNEKDAREFLEAATKYGWGFS